MRFCPLVPALSVCTTKNSLASSLLPPIRYLHTPGCPSSLTLSLYVRCSPPLIFMALHWTHSSVSTCPSYWETQHWTQQLTYGLTRARTGRITSIDPLAALRFMQLRRLLAFFAARAHSILMSNLVSTRTPWSFPAELLSSHPWSVLVAVVIPPHGQALALPFVELHTTLRSTLGPHVQLVFSLPDCPLF